MNSRMFGAHVGLALVVVLAAVMPGHAFAAVADSTSSVVADSVAVADSTLAPAPPSPPAAKRARLSAPT